MKSGKPYQIEHRIIRKDSKEVRYVSAYGRIIFHNKKPIRIIGSSQDVTETKRMTKILNEHKDRFEIAMKGSSDGLWDWDIKNNNIYFSPRWKSMLGYKDIELKNDFSTWVKLLHPEDKKRCLSYVDDYTKGKIKGEFRLEFRMRHKDGRYIHILGRAHLIKATKGKPLRLAGTHVDLTEHKAIIEKQSRLSTAIEQASETIVITDIDGNIIYANPSFEKISGYKVEEAIGQNPRILKSGKQDDKYYKKLWNTITRGKVWHGEFINKKKNGQEYIEDATISPIKDDKGKITHFVAIKNDITEKKNAEKILQEKITELENFKRLTIDRELRMAELKEEIARLKKK
jgi:PAS domain S-box-containing protein